MSDQYDELFTLAQAAAKRVSFQWPSVIEVDDLAQDILVRILESPAAFDRVFEEDEITRKAFMVKIAHQVASDQMIDYDRFSGNYTYDTVIVQSLLDDKAWLVQIDKPSTEIFDLKEALDNLRDYKSHHYAEIINRYEFGIVGATSTERMRTSRAVESLTEEMNLIGQRRRKSWVEGPGSRKVVSNSRAAAQTMIDLQGDYGDGRR